MRVIIEKTVDKCSSCDYCRYVGDSWSEPVYKCMKGDFEIFDIDEVSTLCPFIPSTLDKLQNEKDSKEEN
jgi:hypothetical protein